MPLVPSPDVALDDARAQLGEMQQVEKFNEPLGRRRLAPARGESTFSGLQVLICPDQPVFIPLLPETLEHLRLQTRQFLSNNVESVELG